MLSRPLSLLSILALSVSLSACASNPQGGSLSDYIGVGATNVETSCGGGYRVFYRPVEQRVLVRAYEISEAYRSMCESRRGGPPRSTALGVRYEDAALEYLAQTPSLKACTIVSGVEITRLHSEFTLACPAAPGAVAITAKG